MPTPDPTAPAAGTAEAPAPPDLVHHYFAVAIENIEEAIEVVHPDYRLCYVNPAWERLTGYSLAESVGRTPGSLLRSGQHPPEFYEECDRAMRSRGEWRALFTSRRRDGSTFLNTLRARAVVDADGAVRFMVALRRDVTEDHRARAALVESEQRYQLASLATRDGLFDWNLGPGTSSRACACASWLGHPRRSN